MLQSGSEYLKELEDLYKDKMACTERYLMNETIVKLDEQKVSEMIEKVCN